MAHSRHSSAMRSREGQAMAEFLVGMVGIMLLIVGLQQIAILSGVSFKAHHKVREKLAKQMANPMSKYSGDFVFATKTDAGADEEAYTADDVIMEGDDDFFEKGRGFLHAADYSVLEGYLTDYERGNPYYRLADSGFSDLAESFEMFYAEEKKTVEVMPFFRRILGRDQINLQQQAWMPALGGLME